MRSTEVPMLVGQSAVARRLRDEITGAARTAAKVLIVGETGVGKEVVARQIHDQSARRQAPFVAVNCSGIAETLLESELFGHVRGSFTGASRDTVGLLRQAHGGTLFLDELGEMSPRMQAVLLRFTETGEIHQVGSDRPSTRADVRLITATNRDLRDEIVRGTFRQDLYYRLNVIHISVPPLRARGDDILLLVEHYLERAAAAHATRVPALTAGAADVLMAYSWPGNIRELKNIAERLVLLHADHALTADDLPDELLGYGGARAHASPLRQFGGVAAPAAPVVPLDARRDASPEMAGAPGPQDFSPDTVAGLWARMAAGDDFWTVVYRAFKARELTRRDLAALIDRGLQETSGSYTALLKVFNLPASDYKRFHAFLYQQQCNLPVAAYRRRGARRARAAAPRLRVA